MNIECNQLPETKVLTLIGDLYGCRTYRCRIPNIELKRFNVTVKEVAYMPSLPGRDQFQLYVEEFSKYDMIIIQRCYLRDIVNTARAVCDFLGIPLCFETDDDYLHIPPDNPAYYSMVSADLMEEYKHDFQKLEEFRQVGLNNYREIISMMDLVICSTQELKNTLLPYNKNIEVFQNNVEDVFAFRSVDPEHLFVRNGQVEVMNNMGMISIPGYVQMNDKTLPFAPGDTAGNITAPTPRIGWSSTVTHWGQDFNTIMPHWEKIIDKYSESCWFVYIGWERFVQWHTEHAGFEIVTHEDGKQAWEPNLSKRQLPRRVLHIPDSMYDLYLFHLRNLDIGMAPIAPNIFNMSKSDIKAVEYGAWGIPAVLPRFVTYSRNWTDGKNCLMYSNGREFQSQMDLLINDHKLREELGNNAKEYVENNRVERLHTRRRYETYKKLIDSKHKLKNFKPIEEDNGNI